MGKLLKFLGKYVEIFITCILICVFNPFCTFSIEIDKYGSDFLHLTIMTIKDLSTTVATATSSSVSADTNIKNKSQTTIRTQASSTLSAVTNNSSTTPSSPVQVMPKIQRTFSATSMPVSTLTSSSPQSNSKATSPSRNSADPSKQSPLSGGEKNVTRKRREAKTTRATLVKGPVQRLPLYESEKTYSGNVSSTSYLLDILKIYNPVKCL